MGRVLLIVAAVTLANAFSIQYGQVGLDGRIVGGVETSIEKYPYQVSLHHKNNQICGGSLISKRAVLTAAHCVNRLELETLTVRVGSTYRDRGGDVIRPQKISIHPQYTGGWNMDDDIAIIFLEKDVTLSKEVQIVPLAKFDPKIGTMCSVTGWGTLAYEGEDTEILHEVDVPIVDRDDCQNRYVIKNITVGMLCAGFPQGGKDSCQGDSGGPMVANGEQVGIVSWGYLCGDPRWPGVYTNVPYYYDWIVENTKL